MEHDENDTQPAEGAPGATEGSPPPMTPPATPSGMTGEPAGGESGPPAPPPPSPWFAAGGTPLPPAGGWWEAQPGSGPPAAPPRSSGRRLAVTVAVVALLAGGLGAGLDAAVSSSRNAPRSTGTAVTLPKSSTSGIVPTSAQVAQVASAVDPAVVDINTTVASPVGEGSEAAAASGMIVSPSGIVLTNNHVVESATSIRVSIQGHSGSFKAAVLGVDPTQDVALIQIESPPAALPHVSFANSSKVSVGAAVVAIGNALGLGGKPSVASGTITATNRSITAGDELTPGNYETLHNLFETDAPIQSGDSGGPLVNLRGQVVGMDTAAASTDTSTGSLGFAIPINQAQQVAKQIEQHHATSRITLGLTAFLGVQENAGSQGFFGQPSGSSGPGVFISGVISGSPAQAAGLQAGDSITALDGRTTNSIQVLQNAIRVHKPGASVTVTYTGESGSSHTATVKLAGIPL